MFEDSGFGFCALFTIIIMWKMIEVLPGQKVADNREQGHVSIWGLQVRLGVKNVDAFKTSNIHL